MAKVKNAGHGPYSDGVLYVIPGEVVDVPEAQAEYLCSDDSPGKFERVSDAPAKAAVKDKK
jgi:hypothetical protein